MAQVRDYRTNQFQKDWWDEKLLWWGGMTRRDLSWVVVGFILASMYFGFLDWGKVYTYVYSIMYH